MTSVRYRSILGNIHFTLDKTWGQLIENDSSGFLPRLWYPGRKLDQYQNFTLLNFDVEDELVIFLYDTDEDVMQREINDIGMDGTYNCGLSALLLFITFFSVVVHLSVCRVGELEKAAPSFPATHPRHR